MKREKSSKQVMPQMVRKPVKVVKHEEVPVPEIDTQKAVAFAMSIALQMKQRQREEDASRKQEADIVYLKRNVRYSQKDLDVFRAKLLAARDDATAHSALTKGTASLNEEADFESDGGDGTSQSMRMDAINRLEQTHRSINEIDEALHRIGDGTYGVCLTCGCLIAKERLLHRPFAKTCTACQQKLENESAGPSSTRPASSERLP